MREELWRARCAAMGMKVYTPPIRNAKARYYVVRVGRVPGVYHSYAESRSQTRGFPRAEWHSYPTLAEAMAYMQEEAPPEGGDHPGLSRAGRDIHGWVMPEGTD